MTRRQFPSTILVSLILFWAFQPEALAQWSTEVRSLVAAGRAAEARTRLEEIGSTHPEILESGEYLLLMATVSALTKDWARAEEAYRGCLRLQPGESGLQAGLGVSLLRQGKWREAGRAFRHSLEGDPANAEIWFLRGEAELFGDQVPDAVASFREAIRLQPRKSDFYLDFGRFLMDGRAFEQAERVYEEGLKAIPDSLELKFALAVAFQSQLKWRVAQELLRGIATERPSFPRIHLFLGRSLLESGDLDEAEGAFREGLERNPNDQEILLHYGILLKKRGRFTEAAQLLARSVALDPGNARSLVEYARALLELKRLPEAERALREAIAAQADSKEAYFELARLHRLRGEKEEARQALKMYQEILAQEESSRPPRRVLKP